MPTWLKVTLIVGGILLVLFIGVVAAGFYVVGTYGPALVETGKKGIEEGETFGRRTDNEGCLTESLARHKSSQGLGDLIKANVFLRACLEASTPTPGFCEGVPARTEFIKSAHWQRERCHQQGFPDGGQCQQVFAQVQQFCEDRAGVYDSNVNPPPRPAR